MFSAVSQLAIVVVVVQLCQFHAAQCSPFAFCCAGCQLLAVGQGVILAAFCNFKVPFTSYCYSFVICFSQHCQCFIFSCNCHSVFVFCIVVCVFISMFYVAQRQFCLHLDNICCSHFYCANSCQGSLQYTTHICMYAVLLLLLYCSCASVHAYDYKQVHMRWLVFAFFHSFAFIFYVFPFVVFCCCLLPFFALTKIVLSSMQHVRTIE